MYVVDKRGGGGGGGGGLRGGVAGELIDKVKLLSELLGRISWEKETENGIIGTKERGLWSNYITNGKLLQP